MNTFAVELDYSMRSNLCGEDSTSCIATCRHIFPNDQQHISPCTRKQGFIEETKQGRLPVELAQTKAKQQLIAYCVSTITQDRTGEIDSIFVKEECRGEGIEDQ